MEHDATPRDDLTKKESAVKEMEALGDSLALKSSEFLDMYKKVAEFIKELMQQNNMLKERVGKLNDERGRLKGRVSTEMDKDLEIKIEKMRREKKDLLDHYRTVEEENKDFLGRYLEIESENNNLANLYVASYQLHSTLDFVEVLDIITEIIINLIGAQTFGVMLLNEKNGLLQPVKAEGLDLANLPIVPMGEGIIGSMAEAGDVYYREEVDRNSPIDYTNPMVCVPLKIKDQVIGVIAVYRLLQQKEKLVRVDYELFTLLAAHAATAIFGSRLYTDSVRKRETIKGFLDLLTH